VKSAKSFPRSKSIQPMESLPPLPLCLIKDEIELPDRYQPCEWADDLVSEWKAEEKLAAVGAYPTSSVLLIGPSGVGKTTSARWIARQLRMPVFAMLLSTAIDSYLGATGKSIESAVRYAMTVRGVLLLDELDAVAASRQSKNDLGEIWRITNTFIQILDHWHGQRRNSLIVGTTNMADSIDSAIRRRFELEVSIPLPNTKELSNIAGVPIPDNCQMSHAEMRRAVLQAKRQSVLRGTDYQLTLMRLIGR
jgi:AAA+ superfamily predicted ATPase